MLFALKNLNIYQTNTSVHGMNTRQQNKLHIPSIRLFSVQRGVYYSSVTIFNQLPQNIIKFHNNLHTFKTLLREYLINNALYSIEKFHSAGHNDVHIWTFILQFFYYFVMNVVGLNYSQTSVREHLGSWTIQFTNKFSEHKASQMTYCDSSYEHASRQNVDKNKSHWTTF